MYKVYYISKSLRIIEDVSVQGCDQFCALINGKNKCRDNKNCRKSYLFIPVCIVKIIKELVIIQLLSSSLMLYNEPIYLLTVIFV